MSKRTHVLVDLYGLGSEHPQTVMRRLGITYKAAHPIPTIDSWLFADCANVPPEAERPTWMSKGELPDYVADAYGLQREAPP